jgi:sugar lactone lactonase YvrE
MIAATAGALSGMAGERLYAQGADPNAAPNPYKMQENWAQLPEGRKFGAVIKVQIDHSDGKSIWVFDRCGATECTNSTLAPMEKFDSSGKFQKAIGADMFAVPHGFYVDREGNVWGGDQIARNGKGADLIKFAPDGKTLMILGKPGMPGNGPGYLTTGSAVVVAPNGEIYVGDGHGAGTNDRIVKFSKDGKFITAWGKHGKGPGEFDTPHGIFVAEWKQFGRPSDVAIDKSDIIYVADSQSTPSNNQGFKQGIRIGSVKDGKVAAFIPEPSVEAGAPEGIGVDDAGNVYAGWTAKMAVRRYVK